jgi:hypothetical protein
MHSFLHRYRLALVASIFTLGFMVAHPAQSQIGIGKLVNKDKLKNNFARKLRKSWENRLQKLKDDFNKESFSYAIAFTDNAGFYEDKQRLARYQRLSNNLAKL